MDRMDLQVQVHPVPYQDLASDVRAESSLQIRERVIRARQRQLERFAGTSLFCNASMQPRHIRQYCHFEEAAEDLLKTAMSHYGLSARTYHRILKVARTVADLDDSNEIRGTHMAEAIQYRCLDKSNWDQP